MFRLPEVDKEPEELPDRGFYRLDSEDESDPMERLIDALPRSIRYVTFRKQSLGKGELRHLLADLSELKGERLPLLDRLGLHKPNLLSKSMEDSLADAGIKVCP